MITNDKTLFWRPIITILQSYCVGDIKNSHTFYISYLNLKQQWKLVFLSPEFQRENFKRGYKHISIGNPRKIRFNQ